MFSLLLQVLHVQVTVILEPALADLGCTPCELGPSRQSTFCNDRATSSSGFAHRTKHDRVVS